MQQRVDNGYKRGHKIRKFTSSKIYSNHPMDKLPQLSENVLPTDALRIFDETIERYQVYLSTVKAQRNTFVPISRLPPELLCKIFMMVRANDPPENYWTEAVSSLKWVKLTHVSRRWRNIAIASPTLWTLIDKPLLHNILWLKEAIIRSKEAHLSIEVHNILSRDSVPGLKLLLKDSRRIQHLALRVFPEEWKKLKMLLPKSSPELESLSLLRFGPSPGGLIAFCVDDVLGETPKLRRLTLGFFDVSFRKPRVSITHLKLQAPSPNRNLTWQQFADALKCMPCLEVLDLDQSLPIHVEEEVFLASDLIDLPFLKTLCISLGEANPKSAETFLSHSSFPSTTSMMIGYFTHLAFDLDFLFPDLLLALARAISNMPCGRNFQTLLLVEEYSIQYAVRLKFFEDALVDEQMITHQHVIPPLELAFNWSFSSPPSTRLLELADVANNVFENCTSLLQNISHVGLAGLSTESDPVALAQTVGRLSQLRFLMAGKSAHKGLIAALQLRSSDPGNALYFSNLSSVCLYGRSLWDKEFYIKRDKTLDAEHTPSLKSLHDCLIQRRQAGAEITKLTLKLWHKPVQSDDIYVDLLRTIVLLDIDWDDSAEETHADSIDESVNDNTQQGLEEDSEEDDESD